MDGESVKRRKRAQSAQCEAVAQKRLHFVNQLNFQLCVRGKANKSKAKKERGREWEVKEKNQRKVA